MRRNGIRGGMASKAFPRPPGPAARDYVQPLAAVRIIYRLYSDGASRRELITGAGGNAVFVLRSCRLSVFFDPRVRKIRFQPSFMLTINIYAFIIDINLTRGSENFYVHPGY